MYVLDAWRQAAQGRTVQHRHTTSGQRKRHALQWGMKHKPHSLQLMLTAAKVQLQLPTLWLLLAVASTPQHHATCRYITIMSILHLFGLQQLFTTAPDSMHASRQLQASPPWPLLTCTLQC